MSVRFTEASYYFRVTLNMLKASAETRRGILLLDVNFENVVLNVDRVDDSITNNIARSVDSVDERLLNFAKSFFRCFFGNTSESHVVLRCWKQRNRNRIDPISSFRTKKSHHISDL